MYNDFGSLAGTIVWQFDFNWPMEFVPCLSMSCDIVEQGKYSIPPIIQF